MATTSKHLPARVAAGLAAAALAALTALGGALPASAAANIDPTEPASITIHKHEQPAEPGVPGTGSPNDPVAGAPMPGVQFSIQQVLSLDVAANATWDALGSLDADDVLADPAAYPLGESDGVDAWTVTTGDAGTAAQGVPQGVYLVAELSAPVDAGVVIPVQPFLVVVPQPTGQGTWNYDVHVFPKNTVTDAVKEIAPFAQQGLGSAVTWTIEASAPIAIDGASIDRFAIQDTLDARLAHDLADADALRVTVGTTALAGGTDYTATLAAGVLTVELAAPGLAALSANPGATVAVEIDTTVIGVGDGMIDNEAVVIVNGGDTGASTSSAAAGAMVPTNVATDVWGSFTILKHAEGDVAAVLAGAVFEIHDAQGAPVAIVVDGESTTRFTTGADGTAVIPGLRTDADGEQYTLVEVEAPAGYVLPQDPSTTVTVLPGTATPQVAIANEQVPPYALPVTGGSGEAAFMIGGAGLLLGALGVMLLRRRRADAEA